ncbi:MAG: glycosyltransferase family 4 protein [Anaerolineales bacterium]
MRLAINGWFLSHPSTGSGRYLRALLEHLPATDPELEIHVIAPAHVQSAAMPPGCAMHRVPTAATHLGKVRFEQCVFPRAAQRLAADLAHIPYWAPPLRSQVPFVVTVHDIIPLLLPEHRGAPAARLYTSLVAMATRGAAAVIADSDHSRLDIAKHLRVRDELIHTVHLAADAAYRPRDSFEVDATLREKYGLPESYVLYLGGFHRRKNVHHLLAAWTWAHDPIGAHYPLIIAGALPQHPDGRLFYDLKALAHELDVTDSVRFIGHVDEADKPALYQGAACFVYPSSYEGFGLPPLEAMACGTPVVTTNEASLPEVVGDAAYLIADPTDTRKLGAAIIGAVVDEQLADDLRERGLAQASKFTWARTARETVAVYRAAADG